MKNTKASEVGEVLPNGATVLQISPDTVLAFNNGTVQPFITWKYTNGDTKTTYWGHYFDTLKAAVLDFETRR